MTTAEEISAVLDRDRIRRLFDLRSSLNAFTGGAYEDDPYPRWHELRETGPVHAGTVHELLGQQEDLVFHGLPADRQVYSVYSFDACDSTYRNERVFSSAVPGPDTTGIYSSMLSMAGAQHRRYRSLVQPSFVPGRMRWWLERWIDDAVDALIDVFVDDGRAELNVDFCALIPVLTITGSFGFPPEKALDLRENVTNPLYLAEILRDVIAARRERPEDDLISVLVEAEIQEEDGTRHRLADEEILSFGSLLLAAGSGTTWKQMGTVLGALLARPDVLQAVRQDPSLVRAAVDEGLRWMPTDPAFMRWATEDVEHFGVHIPEGSPVQICLGAGSRDPGRWELPDEFDIFRPLKPSLAFGGGPHICLGMHVARTEMIAGVTALLARLPNLRLDPDAEAPRAIGLYERGMTAIPVVWG